jgi:hypothetical protein
MGGANVDADRSGLQLSPLFKELSKILCGR